jgi:hypothetical protein
LGQLCDASDVVSTALDVPSALDVASLLSSVVEALRAESVSSCGLDDAIDDDGSVSGFPSGLSADVGSTTAALDSALALSQFVPEQVD